MNLFIYFSFAFYPNPSICELFFIFNYLSTLIILFYSLFFYCFVFICINYPNFLHIVYLFVTFIYCYIFYVFIICNGSIVQWFTQSHGKPKVLVSLSHPQPVAPDGHPSPSLVLLEVSSS